MKKLISVITILVMTTFARGQCNTPLSGYWNNDFESWNTTFTWDTVFCWVQINGPGFYNDWNVDIQTGPSSTSGPSGAYSGIKYCYFEASGGQAGNWSSFKTPEFLVDSIPHPAIEFWYHMFGADMGSLEIDVTTDGGMTWTTIGAFIGEQHPTQGTPLEKKSDKFGELCTKYRYSSGKIRWI